MEKDKKSSHTLGIISSVFAGMALIFGVMPSRPSSGLTVIITLLAIIGLIFGLLSITKEKSPWAIPGLIISVIIFLLGIIQL